MGSQKDFSKTPFLVALVIVTVVSITATVLALTVTLTVLSRNKSDEPNGTALSASSSIISSLSPSRKTNKTGVPNRIWTVALGNDWGPYEYLDENGYITGFHSEFVKAVCAEAEMDCHLVRDSYTNCYDGIIGEDPVGGRGLLDHWYDACTGWAKTVDRTQVFDFSDPYLEMQPSIFLVKKGNAVLFNGTDLKDKKIVFLDGWGHNEQCLAHHEDNQHRNYKLPPENIIHVNSPGHAVKFLNNGSAYAMFADRVTMLKYTDIEPIQYMEFKCFLSGSAMMTRKDSDFNFYFNKGFHKFRKTWKFAELCKKAKEEHGAQGNVACLEYNGYWQDSPG